jgi:hypothetical protein
LWFSYTRQNLLPVTSLAIAVFIPAECANFENVMKGLSFKVSLNPIVQLINLIIVLHKPSRTSFFNSSFDIVFHKETNEKWLENIKQEISGDKYFSLNICHDHLLCMIFHKKTTSCADVDQKGRFFFSKNIEMQTIFACSHFFFIASFRKYSFTCWKARTENI